MKEILSDLDRWINEGAEVAIARVVDIDGSGPRLPGAAMAVTTESEVAGSVSGGCVEGAVVTEALELLASGDRCIVTFGYSDDEAFSVGLTCGGTIHLFLEPFDWGSLYVFLRDDLLAQRPVALATVVDGPNIGAKLLIRTHESDSSDQRLIAVKRVVGSLGTEGLNSRNDCARIKERLQVVGSLGTEGLNRVVERDARAELAVGRSGIRHYGANGEAREHVVSVFVESFAPPPRMLVFGAVDFTAALAQVAKVLGYRVTVCDARQVFATQRRFPMADEVVVSWPDRLLDEVGTELGSRDAVCVLTHDAKFDVPAIISALATNVGYIGVMGSRRTHDDRTARLREAGVTDTELARLRSPIGLDIGAATPEETAISIVSEIITTRTGRPASALSQTSGPIHG